MQHATSQILYTYWNEIRGERIAPRRFDIEPSQIGTILSETLILECDGTGATTFRLAGTRICEIFGWELRGSSFFDLFSESDRASIASYLEELRTQGSVEVLRAVAGLDTDRPVEFEILMLPLVHTGTSITRVLGTIVPFAAHHPLDGRRLPPLVVRSHERIWPEGRPHAIAAKFRSPPALIPELSGARLVRVQRRSFRVVDGGLDKS